MARSFDSLSEHVYLTLEEAIVDGLIAPGSRLQADEIAKHFGVSRIPVREAMRTLEARGWIVVRPRRGAFVRERNATEGLELFEIRSVLDAQAARWAASRRTDDQLRTLAKIVDEGTQAAKANDVSRLATFNTQFHAQLAVAARNVILGELLTSLSRRVQWYFSAVASSRGLSSWEEHADLVAAVKAGDEEAAARIAVKHTQATRSAFLSMLSDRERLRSKGK